MSRTTKAMFDATKYPPECFSLPRDRRKWRHLCFRRRALFTLLARYSNADGSNVFPGVDKLARELGWSRATTFRFLEDLRELGCVVNETAPNGTHRKTSYRVRRLVFNKLPPPGSGAGHTFPNLGGPVTLRPLPAVESQIQKSASQIHDSESHIEKSGSQIRSGSPTQSLTYGATQPERLTEEPNRPTDGIAAVRSEFIKQQRMPLNLDKGQRERLEAVVEGYSEGELRTAVRRATSFGDFDGLRSARLIAQRITEHLSKWLPAMREEEAERARQIITPRDGR